MAWPVLAATVGFTAACLAAPCRADPNPSAASPPAPDKFWAIHVQATDVLQYHPAFNSPFEGANSLTGDQETANTVNASVFLGLQPWKGGRFWFVLDMCLGFAPGDTLGVAGYVNGEGAKVGHHSPYFRPQRFFYRQTFELGGGDDDVDPDLFEFGGKTTKNRLTLTVGKFGLTDVMDDNQYAHDPENDFLNWAIIDTGSFDYAADAWGFSVGAAAALDEGAWSYRAAVMDLSTVPNNATLTPWFRQFQLDGEVEYRPTWRWKRQGREIKLLGFATRGNDGALSQTPWRWRRAPMVLTPGHRARAPLQDPAWYLAERRPAHQ